MFPKKDKIKYEDKILENIKEKNNKTNKYIFKHRIKKRVKNSQVFTNVKNIEDSGLFNLKTGEVASLLEVKAVDLSLASKQEKTSFFYALKNLYKIPNINIKLYKLDEKINLNLNKVNIDNMIQKFNDNVNRKTLLEESKRLIEDLESNNFTISSKYYWVVIAKDVNVLERQLDEIKNITSNIIPKINIEIISNKLEIYKFLSNLYLTTNTLDQLMWSDLPDLVSPLNIVEKTNMLKLDDKEVQMLTIKNVPPFVDELFF